MRVTSIVAASAVAAVAYAQETELPEGWLGPAPVTAGNSASVLYQAEITSDYVQHAWFNFTGTANGTGVYVSACFHNIDPEQPGPYPYHVHVFATPEDKNCSATGGHLDPFLRLQAPPCDPTQPATCEVGDLSGKHGKIPADEEMYCTSYVDPYLSVVEGDEAFIGNSRSVVIHNANATRIGCANIVLSEDAPAPQPTGNYTQPPTPEPTEPSAGSKLGVSSMILAVAVTMAGLML